MCSDLSDPASCRIGPVRQLAGPESAAIQNLAAMQCWCHKKTWNFNWEQSSSSRFSLALSSPNRPHKKAQETQLNGTTTPTMVVNLFLARCIFLNFLNVFAYFFLLLKKVMENGLFLEMNPFQRHCLLFKSACWPCPALLCPALPCPALPCWRKAFQGSS